MVSPAAGTASASAARQPSSAGEIHDGCAERLLGLGYLLPPDLPGKAVPC